MIIFAVIFSIWFVKKYLKCNCSPYSTFTWGEFNNASALERSLYWCQALHITNNDRYQNNERSQALALLNSPLVQYYAAMYYMHPCVKYT